MAVLLVLAAREAAAGRLTAGDFTVLMTAMVGIIPPLRQLTNVQSDAPARREFRRAPVLGDRRARTSATTGTLPLQRAQGRARIPQCQRALRRARRARRSTTSASPRSPGTVTAIVGRSGSGKSHADQADPALLRTRSRPGAARRPPDRRLPARRPAPPDRAGRPAGDAVRRQHRRQRRLRRNARRRRGRRSPPPCAAPTRWSSSSACPRAWTRAIGENGGAPVRRPAPAPGDRARDAARTRRS